MNDVLVKAARGTVATRLESLRLRMLAFAGTHPHLTWTAAWAVMAATLAMTRVFGEPGLIPIWLAVVCGAGAWGVAGAATLHPQRLGAGFGVWALAYLIAFGLSAVWTARFTEGSLGVLLGLSGGAAAGALLGGVVTPLVEPWTSLARAVVWAVGFLVGAYVGGVVSFFLILIISVAHAPDGMDAAQKQGWALGIPAGGLLASAIALPLTRKVEAAARRRARRSARGIDGAIYHLNAVAAARSVRCA